MLRGSRIDDDCAREGQLHVHIGSPTHCPSTPHTHAYTYPPSSFPHRPPSTGIPRARLKKARRAAYVVATRARDAAYADGKNKTRLPLITVQDDGRG